MTEAQRLYVHLSANGRSARTVQLVHAVLHKAIKQAVKQGLLTRNVCEAVEKPRTPRKAMQTLAEGQVREFLLKAKNDRLYALYVLAISTGLRQGELLGLQWQDIDWANSTISIQRTLIEHQGKLSLSEPKTAKGRRLIKLPEIALQALNDHRDAITRQGHTGPFVFTDTKGGPLRKSNLINRSFKPLLAAAGIPSIRFHDLRHTAATLMLSQHVPAKVVQECLGHSQISVTLDTYSHVLPSMQQEAATKIHNLLSGLV